MNSSSVFQKIDCMLWMRIHRLPQVFAQRWQLRELQRAVAYAYKEVPLYRKLFDKQGVAPSDVRTLDDVRRLPITSKQLFRRHPLEETTAAAFPGKIVWKETSGSTGEPFRFPSSYVHYLMRRFGPVGIGARTIAFMAWGNILPVEMFQRLRIAEIRVHCEPRFKHFLHIPVSDLRKRPETVVPRLKEFAPDLLNAHATILVELARLAHRFSPEERPHIPYMISHGEVLTRTQRNYIREVFGAEPYNRYGLEEVGSVAIDCENHTGGHIHEESFIVEILDEADRPLPEGETGRIVITYFYNDVMPIIRYDTGDQGVVASGPCACGVPARRILVDGRKGGFLTIGSRRFNNVEFEVLLGRMSDNILRYQVAKVAPDAVLLRIIPVDRFREEDLAFVRERFREEFGFAPEIKIVDDIAYAAGGKGRFITDETSEKS
ncbi:MAG: hypothetical protein A3G64_02040 [Candidatus Liptonbacteria bacterium RIFCSPLOWO2_12_FULL_60_15]|uniref:AMP-dependent synthetase/ligase domain-containing protein n=1 Tax=Candidatus Liptonbacteria bacterium RIFCSPLOWO2_12_FULL_60_15 TaxID=1798653 RepID=A0A1G2CKP3_9BACT|nr:MAG: Capsular polysaccharide biosynthesis protein [Parcubacteria group bacterium GW2011_GWB1_55_9]OGZ01955.1 MAG: hypothetical protein A3G64_02040 [Candidatus Liptonbacteria bacterium RIFCSPLOWO2_12_FULL_60_15]